VLWRTWAIGYRSSLIHDEKLIITELFWYARKGQPPKRMLWPVLLKMLPHVDAMDDSIGDASGHVHVTFLLDNVTSLVLSCFMFLLDHVSCPSCSTCKFFIRACVMMSLVHLLHFHWTTYLVLIGLCGNFLFEHASQCCRPTCHFLIRPHGLASFFHVSDFYWPTCHDLTLAHVMYWFIHVSKFYLLTCLVLILPRAQQSLH
jgi:hypothetical protein